MIAASAALVFLIMPGRAGAAPICHWTHHKRGDVTYYVQACTVKRHVAKRHANRWNQAGPHGNTTPRIG
jgi:hypothetical protein